MKKAFLFSGQGSQYYQMGRSLYQANACFRKQLDAHDEIAADFLGYSLLDVLYGDKKRSDPFTDQTSVTGAAICMIELALSATLVHHDVLPDCVVGASLGVFAGAAVAGGMSAEQALMLVVRQGQLFDQLCPEGAMMAVLAPPDLHRRVPALSDQTEIAGINFDQHFVVSLPRTAVEAVEQALTQAGVVHQRMPVARAFHSRWIEAVEPLFKSCVDAMSLPRDLILPLVCCAPAGYVSKVDASTLWQTVRQPILFQATINRLEEEGPWQYIDVGPSGTLATFLKYALRPVSGSTAHPLMTLFDQDVANFHKLAPVNER